ncbi:unnamed protein product, partial [Polarella glacialis]
TFPSLVGRAPIPPNAFSWTSLTRAIGKMWLLSFGLCRRRANLTSFRQLCRSCFSCQCVRRRLPKEKGDLDDDRDLEASELKVFATPAPSLGNGQDAEELGPGLCPAHHVPSWQIPELVVECSQRPGARIHKGTSLILPEAGGDLLACIVGSLPVLLQIRPRWHLGYSMAVDGVSLRTMYRQLADVGPCVLIVEDSCNGIFGAFLSEGLRPVSQCYGTHECFVFRTPRTAGAWRTEVYGRTAFLPPVVQQDDHTDQSQTGPAQGTGQISFSQEKAEYFEALRKSQGLVMSSSPQSWASVFCNHTGIVVGIDGPALFVDQDLLRGTSWPSAAFCSPSLATAGTDFVVRNLEVWHW